MRYNIDTLTRIIEIYDWEPIEGKEILVFSQQYESGLEFMNKVHYIFSKNTNEIREEIRELNKGVKKQLKDFLREYGVPQDELYNRTGYHFEDVKLYTDLVEVKRLIDVY